MSYANHASHELLKSLQSVGIIALIQRSASRSCLVSSAAKDGRFMSSQIRSNFAETCGVRFKDDDLIPFVNPASRRQLPNSPGSDLDVMAIQAWQRHPSIDNNGNEAHSAQKVKQYTPGLDVGDVKGHQILQKHVSYDNKPWRTKLGGKVLQGGARITPATDTVVDVSNLRRLNRAEAIRGDTQPENHEARDLHLEGNRGERVTRSAEGARRPQRPREQWQTQKEALARKFGSIGWSPRKRLSPDALHGIRALHAQDADKYTTPVLADQFQISAEAIRRILKSKWRPDEDEEEARRERWEKRGKTIWSQKAQLGMKPPKKWRAMCGSRSAANVSTGHLPQASPRWTGLTGEFAGSNSRRTRVPLADRIC